MTNIFDLINDVGLPIAAAMAAGFFIFTIIKQMLSSVIEQIPLNAIHWRWLA